MSNLHKITALLFSGVLFFISIMTENYCLLLNSTPQNNGYETISSYYSTEKLDLFDLNRQGEKVVTSLKNLPVQNLKNRANDFYSNILSPGIRKLKTDVEYLSFSGTVYRNLTNSDIVFPFHCFW
jgi:hypothetical protein